jgi:hypothetical protein
VLLHAYEAAPGCMTGTSATTSRMSGSTARMFPRSLDGQAPAARTLSSARSSAVTTPALQETRHQASKRRLWRIITPFERALQTMAWSWAGFVGLSRQLHKIFGAPGGMCPRPRKSRMLHANAAMEGSNEVAIGPHMYSMCNVPLSIPK